MEILQIPLFWQNIISVAVGATMTLSGAILVVQVKLKDEKKDRKLTVCNDIMVQSYLITAYYKVVLRSNIEFRYHEKLYRLDVDSNFNKELMISYMKQFDSLEIDFYKETGALLNSIEVYQILFGQNDIIEENRIKLEKQKVDYKVNYFNIVTAQELDVIHEGHRRKLSTFIKEELHPPHIIIQNIVEAERKNLKI